MRSDTQNWIETAEYDLETARHRLAAGRYLYVVFMCHLALEKILKAPVTEVTQTIPPKSHDMAQAAPQLTSIIKKFQNELEKAGIRCEQILLYGSYRWDIAVEGSDIDLIVISPDWAAFNRRERLEFLGVIAARLLEPIQAQGWTPQEIATQQISQFWLEILNKEAVTV